jgi:hypothetical protein
MDDTQNSLELLQRRLAELLEDIRQRESEQVWKEVEITSQNLANGLRVRDGPGKTNVRLAIYLSQ